jgi:hypothetical protein
MRPRINLLKLLLVMHTWCRAGTPLTIPVLTDYQATLFLSPAFFKPSLFQSVTTTP